MISINTLESSDVIAIAALVLSTLTALILGLLSYSQNKTISKLQILAAAKEANHDRLLRAKSKLEKLKRKYEEYEHIAYGRIPVPGSGGNVEEKRGRALLDSAKVLREVGFLYESIKSILPGEIVQNVDKLYGETSNFPDNPLEALTAHLAFARAFDEGLDIALPHE